MVTLSGLVIKKFGFSLYGDNPLTEDYHWFPTQKYYNKDPISCLQNPTITFKIMFSNRKTEVKKSRKKKKQIMEWT